MLQEVLRFLVYGLPGWVAMTIAFLAYIDSWKNK